MSVYYFIIGFAIGWIITLALLNFPWPRIFKDRCEKGEPCGCDEAICGFVKLKRCSNKPPKNK